MKKRSRVRPAGGISFKGYDIISDAVERGVQYGMTRAYKHTNDPSSDYIAEQVEQAVMGALCEVLSFDADMGEP